MGLSYPWAGYFEYFLVCSCYNYSIVIEPYYQILEGDDVPEPVASNSIEFTGREPNHRTEDTQLHNLPGSSCWTNDLDNLLNQCHQPCLEVGGWTEMWVVGPLMVHWRSDQTLSHGPENSTYPQALRCTLYAGPRHRNMCVSYRPARYEMSRNPHDLARSSYSIIHGSDAVDWFDCCAMVCNDELASVRGSVTDQ
jgi:hypothetical protein